MKYPVYCIRDLLTGFMTPTIDQNDASAMRNFVHAVKNADSLFCSHTRDFSLYKIGEFDNETGEIIGCMPELVTDGSSVL